MNKKDKIKINIFFIDFIKVKYYVYKLLLSIQSKIRKYLLFILFEILIQN